MTERSKTLAAVAILVVLFTFVVVSIILIVTKRNIVSPLPEESAIKIIFISPTSMDAREPSASAGARLTPASPTKR